jgi:hypothetical protein
MRKSLFVIALSVAAWAATAQARPVSIIGPGLNTGRTEYHQTGDRTLYADSVYVLIP